MIGKTNQKETMMEIELNRALVKAINIAVESGRLDPAEIYTLMKLVECFYVNNIRSVDDFNDILDMANLYNDLK